MIAEFALINYFLYGALGACGISAGAMVLGKNRDKIGKLANNEIKGYKELKSMVGDEGLNITKNIRLKEKSDFEGICLIGPTGGYKTTTLFMNNLLENNIRGSYVVTDPKGELFETSSSYQKNICGRKVYKIDLINPDYSEKYNLLEGCKNTKEVLQLASNLLINGSLSIELITSKKVGGIEWIQMAEPLFASALLYTKNLSKPYSTVEFALNLLLTLSSGNFEKLILGSGNLDAITQYNIFNQVAGADKTEGSIKITLSTNTKLFVDKDVNKINGETTFDIENFRSEESILYITYPERESSYLAPFIAPLFSQIMDKLLDNYNSKSLPIHMLFEEFCNIGMLSNMSVNAATVRSRRISLTTCLQSISQLNQIYGISNAKSILNNLKTKLILPGISDTDTLNYISSLCGNGEIKTKNISVSGGKQSYSISQTRRKLFEEGELRTLEDMTVLVIANNKMPVIDEIEPYFESDKVDNVSDPIRYKKSKNIYYDISNEIERLKKSSNQKEVDLDDEFEGSRADSRANTIARKIFTR